MHPPNCSGRGTAISQTQLHKGGMDDVLVFSRNVQEHLEHLRRALELLREKQWYVKAQQCSFFMQLISLLGCLFRQQAFNLIRTRLKRFRAGHCPSALAWRSRSSSGLRRTTATGS